MARPLVLVLFAAMAAAVLLTSSPASAQASLAGGWHVRLQPDGLDEDAVAGGSDVFMSQEAGFLITRAPALSFGENERGLFAKSPEFTAFAGLNYSVTFSLSPSESPLTVAFVQFAQDGSEAYEELATVSGGSVEFSAEGPEYSVSSGGAPGVRKVSIRSVSFPQDGRAAVFFSGKGTRVSGFSGPVPGFGSSEISAELAGPLFSAAGYGAVSLGLLFVAFRELQKKSRATDAGRERRKEELNEISRGIFGRTP